MGKVNHFLCPKGGMLESHAVPVLVWISFKRFRFQRLLWKTVPRNCREGNGTMVPRNCTAWGRVEIKEAIQKLEKGIGLWDPEGGGLGMKAREGVFQTSNPCSSRHR